MDMQEQGYTFTLNGANRCFFSTVALVSADNPISNALGGGFKESSSASDLADNVWETNMK